MLSQTIIALEFLVFAGAFAAFIWKASMHFEIIDAPVRTITLRIAPACVCVLAILILALGLAMEPVMEVAVLGATTCLLALAPESEEEDASPRLRGLSLAVMVGAVVTLFLCVARPFVDG